DAENALTPLAVFPSVAQGKVSAPQAVTPSYTREYLAALLRDLFFTTLSCAPGCPPCSVPCNVQMPASVIWVSFSVTSGRTGDGTGRKFKNVKK
ncbi:unnamed protein product, partial [Staurois parvus]